MRWFLSLLLLFALVIASPVASAQTFTVPPANALIPEHLYKCTETTFSGGGGCTGFPRSSIDNTLNRPLGSMNGVECKNDVQLSYAVSVGTQVVGYELQVWGTSQAADCSQDENRTQVGKTCFPLTDRVRLQDIQPTGKVRVRVQDVASTLGKTTAVGGPAYTRAGVEECSGKSAAVVTYKLYFLTFAAGATSPSGQSTAVDVKVDVQGPSGPSRSGNPGAGDGRVEVRFASTDAQDTQGFIVFCDPQPGWVKADGAVSVPANVTLPDASANTLTCSDSSVSDAAVSTTDADDAAAEAAVTDAADLDSTVFDGEVDATDDAATSSDAEVESGVSTDAGTSSDACAAQQAVCSVPGAGPTVLGDGLAGDEFSVYQCSDAITGGTSTTGIISGLRNGAEQSKTVYHFAVSAYDQLGNIGPMTYVGCEWPSEVLSVWDQYRNAGGQAGGGYCAFEPAGLGAPVTVMGLVVAVAFGAFLQRRRRS